MPKCQFFNTNGERRAQGCWFGDLVSRCTDISRMMQGFRVATGVTRSLRREVHYQFLTALLTCYNQVLIFQGKVSVFLDFVFKKARSILKLVKNTTFCKSRFLNRERPPKYCKLLKLYHLNLQIWRHFAGSAEFAKNVFSIERGHIFMKKHKTNQNV